MRKLAPDSALAFLNSALHERFDHRTRARPVDAIVFDMDGTLVDVDALAEKHLNPKPGAKRDFDAFHRESEFAPPHQHVVEAAQRAYLEGTAVLVVTARMTDYVGVSSRWLAKQPVWLDQIYMRRSQDFRPDYDVKREIVDQIRADGYNIMHAWDDNPAIITLWNELGIPNTVVPNPRWHPETTAVQPDALSPNHGLALRTVQRLDAERNVSEQSLSPEF